MKSQTPPTALKKNWTAPAAISPYATYSPVLDAMRVARNKLRLRAQTIERKTRPPSSGKPGSMLNAAMAPLISAR